MAETPKSKFNTFMKVLFGTPSSIDADGNINKGTPGLVLTAGNALEGFSAGVRNEKPNFVDPRSEMIEFLQQQQKVNQALKQQQLANRLSIIKAGGKEVLQSLTPDAIGDNQLIQNTDGSQFLVPSNSIDAQLDQLKLSTQQLTNQKLKADIERRQNPFQDFGGDIPPGTTFNTGTGAFNIPLNPRGTDEEKTIIANNAFISDAIDGVVSKIDEGIASGLFEQLLVDTGKPFLVGGDLEALQSDLNKVKAKVPFTLGGKQLTKTERNIVFALVNITGKEPETIKRDLLLFKDVMGEMERITRLGLRGAEGEKAASELIGSIESATSAPSSSASGGEMTLDNVLEGF